jgi:hypothetical protein
MFTLIYQIYWSQAEMSAQLYIVLNGQQGVSSAGMPITVIISS